MILNTAAGQPRLHNNLKFNHFARQTQTKFYKETIFNHPNNDSPFTTVYLQTEKNSEIKN